MKNISATASVVTSMNAVVRHYLVESYAFDAAEWLDNAGIASRVVPFGAGFNLCINKRDWEEALDVLAYANDPYAKG